MFLQWCVDQMTEAGETEDVNLATEEMSGRAVHGYAYSDNESRLDLFLTDYKNASEVFVISPKKTLQNFNRLENFLVNYLGKNENDIEISSPVFDLVEIIQKARIKTVRMIIVTNGKCVDANYQDKEVNGMVIKAYVWDITQILHTKNKF